MPDFEERMKELREDVSVFIVRYSFVLIMSVLTVLW